MTTDSETMEQYLNFVRTRFLISVLIFVSRAAYELGRVSDFGGVDRQFPYGAIFIHNNLRDSDRKKQDKEESTTLGKFLSSLYESHDVGVSVWVSSERNVIICRPS